MIMNYSRPQGLDPQQLDPAAPAADLDPTGDECQAETVDVDGTPWSCTRRPGHTDDEHRAVFGQLGDGPAEAVAIAWAYEWGGAGHGPASPEPVHTITVTITFPETAATGVDADRIAADVLANFWECDHDHVRVAVTSSTRPA
ncbi:hypothetical protein [Frondihabitans sp. PhB161]|nr:hypothetical protein [Frondihabitans sp. PhB161]RPE73733.1 hypothetical protein EDF37_3430 [Frondihabitans sp. PhB153]RPF02130.1 hypothetical protein EDF39_3451 [Frondihabitans sp. PhB161]